MRQKWLFWCTLIHVKLLYGDLYICDIIHTRTHRRLTYLFMYIEKLSLGRTGGRLSLVSSPRLPSEREARAYIPPGGRRPFAHDPFAHGTPGEQAHASAVRRCSRFSPLFALVKSSLFALVKPLDRRVSVARNHSARTDPGKLA